MHDGRRNAYGTGNVCLGKLMLCAEAAQHIETTALTQHTTTLAAASDSVKAKVSHGARYPGLRCSHDG